MSSSLEQVSLENPADDFPKDDSDPEIIDSCDEEEEDGKPKYIKRTMEDALVELKTLLKEEAEENELIETILDNDKFLKVFLAARHNRPDVAFDIIKGYLKVRHIEFPEIFGLSVEDVRHVLESECVSVLKNRDKHGRRVVVARIDKLDPYAMPWEQLVKATSLSFEYFWDNLDDVKKGVVVIGNTEGFSFGHYWNYSISQYANFLKIFWFNYPSKVKGLHWIKIPSLAYYLYTLLTPLLPSALTNLMHLYYDDYEALHEHISPEILPTWLGGVLSDEEALDKEFVQKFLREVGGDKTSLD